MEVGKVKGKLILRQVVTWCTLLVFMVTFLPGNVLAVESQPIALEQAVKSVKSVFEVPKEFTRFSSGYSQYENRQVWQLRWETEKEPNGNMNAQVDCQTGEILNMNFWQSTAEPDPQGKLPAISRAEAVKIAEKLVQSLHPQRFSELKLEEDNGELLPLMSWGSGNYGIKWTRLVQGVPFPQDGVTVDVDNQTGRVTGYRFNWTEGDFPNVDKAISLAIARQAWEKTEMLQLQYFRPYTNKPNQDAAQQRQVLLVYRLDHPSGGVLDALTGKPLELDNDLLRKTAMGMGDSGLMNAKEEAAVNLTPQEMEEIEEASQVISKEQAESVVRQWVSIPQKMPLQGAYLNRDEWREVGARTWNLNWQNEGKEQVEGEVRWLNANVDAVKGVLLGFSWDRNWLKEDSQQVQRLTREESQKKAEAFLRKIQPTIFAQTKLSKSRIPEPRPLIAEELPVSQYFQYQRLVNNVVFPDNGLAVTVDAVTGQIQAYQLRWQELQFPTTKEILNQSQITDRFLKRQPLTLQYMQVVVRDESSTKREIKLVYRPVAEPSRQGEAMSDARTGEALDWQGKPLAEQPSPYKFTDIAGHWAEKEIALLGQAGLFGEYGATFRPDAPITVVQYFRALLMMERGAVRGYALSDEEVMEQAKQRGWLKEELKPSDMINRLMLARYTIRFLGLDRAARVEGIYQAPYQDMQDIPVAAQGYVALSWGLGILKGEQGCFRPQQTVPRAQAAVTLIRMLQTDTK
jgi:hypothetical protein